MTTFKVSSITIMTTSVNPLSSLAPDSAYYILSTLAFCFPYLILYIIFNTHLIYVYHSHRMSEPSEPTEPTEPSEPTEPEPSEPTEPSEPS